MPVSSRIRRPDDAGDVAVRNELDAGAGFAHGSDQFRVPRPIEDAGHDLADRHALGLGQRVEIIGRRRIEIDDVFGIAGADGDLVHVHIGRVQQAAPLGDREHGERVRHGLGADRRAFERIDGDVDFRAFAGADLLADVEHRRFVHLAFADDDGASDLDAAELRRMASTAALSAAFSLPRPRSCAAAIAAASVTRASSSTRMRSRPGPCVPFDWSALLISLSFRLFAGSMCKS